MCRNSVIATVLSLVLFCVCRDDGSASASAATPVLDVGGYDARCGVEVSQSGALITVLWPLGNDQRGRMVFSLSDEEPLIRSIAIASVESDFRPIAESLDPALLLRVGDRDLEKRGGWTIFFDRMQRKPSEVHTASLERVRAKVTSRFRRVMLAIGDVSAGPFQGEFRWTFFADHPFILQEAVVSTRRKRTAFLYDMGLVFRQTQPQQMSWTGADGIRESEPVAAFSTVRRLAVRGRVAAAGFHQGSIALFPPPHRYFYPLDFSDNLKNIWVGSGYQETDLPFGFGIRHDARGDDRYVPWFNAPPDTRQELGLFLLVSDGSPEVALSDVAELTRRDRFESLPGHCVFTSHYHVEHTRELMEAQEASDDDREDNAVTTGTLASGGTYSIPSRLANPGFTRVFRDMGVDIVHLAEFHFGKTPKMNQQERLRHLELLHAECRRLSDPSLLLLPGEEPNVHLGGHWISFFPEPVYWVLNRPEGTPFVKEDPKLGRVYHTGSEADVLRLLRAEGGLAWTAHPRIKGSTGFPDRYRDRLFFQSDRFLGGAWKSMPVDLSEPRLGSRVLNLLDDMSNWGDPKYAPGEVDVFKIQPDHELYAHMNVNYLRLDRVPRFEEGWQPVLDALRQGKFFVTTGEVLLRKFTVHGVQSGEAVSVSDSGPRLRSTRPEVDLPAVVRGDHHGRWKGRHAKTDRSFPYRLVRRRDVQRRYRCERRALAAGRSVGHRHQRGLFTAGLAAIGDRVKSGRSTVDGRTGTADAHASIDADWSSPASAPRKPEPCDSSTQPFFGRSVRHDRS